MGKICEPRWFPTRAMLPRDMCVYVTCTLVSIFKYIYTWTNIYIYICWCISICIYIYHLFFGKTRAIYKGLYIYIHICVYGSAPENRVCPGSPKDACEIGKPHVRPYCKVIILKAYVGCGQPQGGFKTNSCAWSLYFLNHFPPKKKDRNHNFTISSLPLLTAPQRFPAWKDTGVCVRIGFHVYLLLIWKTFWFS